MSTIKIPQNGLPQEIANIPFGQVIVLTDPEQGITAKHITLMEAIITLANRCGQGHIINTRSVDFSGLWDCFVCKVKADEVLISDKDSLFEMLCEFWGLDYKEACKTIVMDGRAKFIPSGGEEHPVRVHIKPTVRAEAVKDDYGASLQYLHAHSRQGTLGDIRSTFKDNFNYELGITLDDIITLYKEEELNRKAYRLDIQVKWKEVYEHPKWVKIMKECNLSLVDSDGNKYPLKMKARSKAIYLTFILYKEGLRIQDVSGNEEFYKLFSKIFDKMPRALNKPAPFVFFDEELNYTKEYGLFNDKLNNIRKAILDATDNNDYLRERFAVEGDVGFPYKVAGATDEHRALIKKEFGLK